MDGGPPKTHNVLRLGLKKYPCIMDDIVVRGLSTYDLKTQNIKFNSDRLRKILTTGNGIIRLVEYQEFQHVLGNMGRPAEDTDTT